VWTLTSVPSYLQSVMKIRIASIQWEDGLALYQLFDVCR